jgi:uncharacterized membrane protein
MDDAATTRLEAFSDGVFAIAITLLILEIKVPDTADVLAAGGLAPALAQRWPSYVGYVTSFVITAIMWANHHALFGYIVRVDRRLMMANLLLLMGVSFLPFPTAVLAEHSADPATRTAATAFYGATLVFTAISFNALWWAGCARGRRLLADVIEDAGARTITIRYASGPIAYAAATGLAFVNVWLSLTIQLGVALWNAKTERATGSGPT